MIVEIVAVKIVVRFKHTASRRCARSSEILGSMNPLLSFERCLFVIRGILSYSSPVSNILAVYGFDMQLNPALIT